MPPIRVLIVDDSVVVRKVLGDVLAADPDIEVVGTAASGYLAVAKIPQLNPDLITLDIEMPGMDGLQTLKQIRRLYPKLPVIMFSTLTERGATATLEALSLGASDYATKPSNSDSSMGAREHVRLELIPKIKTLAGVRTAHPAHFLAKPPLVPSRSAHKDIDIVAIGASTGGPNALAEVLPCLPAGFPLPVVIVQHMPPLFTRLLAERLDALSPLKVREGLAGGKLEPGQAWIAPGGFHMTLDRKGRDVVLALNEDPPENSCRPAVDVLFRSVAEVYGPHVLGVVLTGMGADGLRGSQRIREAGGEVFAQDEATAVVWGMPGAVVAAGQADHIYPLDKIGEEVVRRVNSRGLSDAARLGASPAKA